MRYPPGTAVVHFILNECRALIFFYTGFKSGIKNEMIFLAGTDPDRTAFRCDHVAVMPVNYTQLLISDANHAISLLPTSVSEHFYGEYQPKCTIFNHHWFLMNAIGVSLIAGMAVGMIVAVIVKRCEMESMPVDKITFAMEEKGITEPEKVHFDALSGYYIDFTNKMERRWWYQLFAWLIVLYTGAAVVYMIITVLFSDRAQEFKWFYVTTQMLPILQMVYGAWKLKFASFGCAIATGDKCFKMLRFRRGWLSILNQSNKELCMQLETATYRARYGRPANLHKMINFEEVNVDIKKEQGCEALVHSPHVDPDKKLSYCDWIHNLFRGQDPDEPHGVNPCEGCQHLKEALEAAEKAATEAAAENPPRKVHTFLRPNIRNDDGGKLVANGAQAPLLA